MKNAHVLSAARARLGLWNCKKEKVFAAAARSLSRRVPKSTRGAYSLLREFLKKGKSAPALPFAVTNDFLQTYEWRQLRMVVLTKRGNRCECCGATPPDVVIHVDHIKPRRKYPELALEESNLQILCEVCNHGKGSWDETDWRSSGTTQGELKDSPVPGTATATSKVSSFTPRLVRKR
jgi:hypothetical protein